ncbi:hypothetical protein V6N13_133611 [Hibiscus sabdariffa]|uniref:Uncharacterized protein n=2 Tax=Hibiscus sabdariffa TaxID=183260 RepID=A0ABR2BPJ7_9ROSI
MLSSLAKQLNIKVSSRGQGKKQGGRRRPQVEAKNALVIQLTPCCQSLLDVLLAKAGVSAGFTYSWI